MGLLQENIDKYLAGSPSNDFTQSDAITGKHTRDYQCLFSILLSAFVNNVVSSFTL